MFCYSKENVFLICLILSFISCVISSKVKLGVYIESLCPDSRHFFNNQLTPTYQLLSNIVDIDLVPYGNSHWKYDEVTKEVTFECQHGEQECFGNKIQSCVISKAENNTKLSIEFIDCMFRSANWKVPILSGRECSKKLDISWSVLYDCAVGPYATILELQMANKTDSLRPPQNWIPWITVDGIHTAYNQMVAESDLEKLICDSYKGDKPYECGQRARNE